jgi:lysophospholipase L1-like esterase
MLELGISYSSIFRRSNAPRGCSKVCILPSHKIKSSHAISLLASYRSNPDQIYKDWNKALAETVRQFANANHSEITAMIFSSYDTFTNVLDDPVSCGFTSEDVRKEEGGIWYDHLHPTSRMHDIIAANMAQFLGDQFEFGFVED